MNTYGNPWILRPLAFLVLAFLHLPIVVMIIFSFNDNTYPGLPFNGFTTQWYAAILENDDLLRSIGNSLVVAAGVVTISVVFGLPAAIALDRYDFPGKGMFRRIVLLPIVLPGVISGVALLGFYIFMNFRLSLYTLMLGVGTALMCITITEVFARLQQVGRSQEEAAYDMGATTLEVFWHVTLPSIRSALLGAMLITFSICIDEIAVTYLLTGRENTLPMAIWSMLRRDVSPVINAVATLAVLVSLVTITVGITLSRGRSLLGRKQEV